MFDSSVKQCRQRYNKTYPVDVYLEPSWKSMMEIFVEISNGFQSLTILAKKDPS